MYESCWFAGELLHKGLWVGLWQSSADELAQGSYNWKVDVDEEGHEENGSVHKHLRKNYLKCVFIKLHVIRELF